MANSDKLTYFHVKKYRNGKLHQVLTGCYKIDFLAGVLRFAGGLYRDIITDDHDEEKNWNRRNGIAVATERFLQDPFVMSFTPLCASHIEDLGYYQYRRLESFIHSIFCKYSLKGDTIKDPIVPAKIFSLTLSQSEKDHMKKKEEELMSKTESKPAAEHCQYCLENAKIVSNLRFCQDEQKEEDSSVEEKDSSVEEGSIAGKDLNAEEDSSEPESEQAEGRRQEIARLFFGQVDAKQEEVDEEEEEEDEEEETCLEVVDSCGIMFLLFVIAFLVLDYHTSQGKFTHLRNLVSMESAYERSLSIDPRDFYLTDPRNFYFMIRTLVSVAVVVYSISKIFDLLAFVLYTIACIPFYLWSVLSSLE